MVPSNIGSKMFNFAKYNLEYFPTIVNITEVSARDGLQAQKKILSCDQRVRFINKLTNCGFKSIEIGSFVSPKIIPQMADTTAVSIQILKKKGVKYTSLIPNEYGLKSFLSSESNDGAILLSACEEFSKKNINKSIDESLKIAELVCATLKSSGISYKGYISCAFNSSFSKIDLEKVSYLANVLKDLSCSQIVLADTSGTASLEEVDRTISKIKQTIHPDLLGVHFHDSLGHGIENVLLALAHDIKNIDSSILGIGGCPNSPNAKGNINTLSLLNVLESFGIDHQIDKQAVCETSKYLEEILFK